MPRERFEIYDNYLRVAYELLKHKLDQKDLSLFHANEAFRADLCNTVAERLAVGEGFTPPTFTNYTTCKQCGEMPSPDDFADMSESCPWCSGDWRKTYKRLMKEWRACAASQGSRREHFAGDVFGGEKSLSGDPEKSGTH